MEQHEIELGIKMANRKIREIQEQVLNDLAKDLRLKGRVLTYEDVYTLKQVQVVGSILTNRIEKFYSHFADNENVAPVTEDEDEYI